MSEIADLTAKNCVHIECKFIFFEKSYLIFVCGDELITEVCQSNILAKMITENKQKQKVDFVEHLFKILWRNVFSSTQTSVNQTSHF